MQFTSLGFFVFFPAAALLYFLVPGRLRAGWLLLVSLAFYLQAGLAGGLALLFSIATTYAAGRLLETRKRKAVLVVTLLVNIGILLFFKYFAFFLENVNLLRGRMGAGVWENPFRLILPLGISYYTFQVIAYLTDVYRGTIRAEKNFLHYALFVSFFPKVVSGPIERGEKFLPQIKACLNGKLWDGSRVAAGLSRMLWGYFLKLVLADRAAILVDEVFGSYWLYGSVELWTAALFFYIQIFCDFAGYTNIALGMAQVMGFSLQENFNAPYFARTIKDFWGRWHISLSLWLRDYIYIPLGGNRKGRLKKYRNLFLTFLVSGLWHGASWGFVIWGGLHGFYQIAGDVVKPYVERINGRLHTKTESFSYRAMQTMKTFLLAAFAFIFFRARTGIDGLRYVKRMFTHWNPWALFDGSLYQLGLSEKYWHLFLFLLLFLLVAEGLHYRKGARLEQLLSAQCIWFRWGVWMALFLAIVILGAYGPAYEAENFIYFQF